MKKLFLLLLTAIVITSCDKEEYGERALCQVELEINMSTFDATLDIITFVTPFVYFYPRDIQSYCGEPFARVVLEVFDETGTFVTQQVFNDSSNFPAFKTPVYFRMKADRDGDIFDLVKGWKVLVTYKGMP